MNQLITVRTFSSLTDSEMAKAYLESLGVKCYIQDEFISRVYVPNVAGGVKLQVEKEDLETAIELLKDGGYLSEEDLEPSSEYKFIEKILNKFRK